MRKLSDEGLSLVSKKHKKKNKKEKINWDSAATEFGLGDLEEVKQKRKGLTIEEVRNRIKKELATRITGRVYEAILLICSFVSTVFLIYQTESENYEIDFYFSELVFSCLFMFDWALNLFLADHKTDYLTSFEPTVNLFAVVPIWFIYSFKIPRLEPDMSTWDGFLYFIAALNNTRIYRLLRVRKYLMNIEDEVQRHVAEMGLTFLIMIFFDAALMQYLENHIERMTSDGDRINLMYFDWMYYVCVTITTVGYGDIAPLSTLGRFTAMAYISTSILLIPQLTNALFEKISRSSVYQRNLYRPKKKFQHCVVCGDIRSTSLRELFQELFHEDHEMDNYMKAVVMNPTPPNYSMMSILEDPVLSLNVLYIEGSAFNEKDLNRASVHTATAIFILTNKFTEDPDQEDAKVILQLVNIKRYLNNFDSNEMLDERLFCIQVNQL